MAFAIILPNVDMTVVGANFRFTYTVNLVGTDVPNGIMNIGVSSRVPLSGMGTLNAQVGTDVRAAATALGITIPAGAISLPAYTPV